MNHINYYNYISQEKALKSQKEEKIPFVSLTYTPQKPVSASESLLGFSSSINSECNYSRFTTPEKIIQLIKTNGLEIIPENPGLKGNESRAAVNGSSSINDENSNLNNIQNTEEKSGSKVR